MSAVSNIRITSIFSLSVIRTAFTLFRPPLYNTFPLCAISIYIFFSVHVYVTELLLNGLTDIDEIFCVSSGGFENGLDLQFGPIKNIG